MPCVLNFESTASVLAPVGSHEHGLRPWILSDFLRLNCAHQWARRQKSEKSRKKRGPWLSILLSTFPTSETKNPVGTIFREEAYFPSTRVSALLLHTIRMQFEQNLSIPFFKFELKFEYFPGRNREKVPTEPPPNFWRGIFFLQTFSRPTSNYKVTAVFWSPIFRPFRLLSPHYKTSQLWAALRPLRWQG